MKTNSPKPHALLKGVDAATAGVRAIGDARGSTWAAADMILNQHRRKLSLVFPASVFLLFSALERIEVSAFGDAIAFSLGLEEPAAKQVVQVSYHETHPDCPKAGCIARAATASSMSGGRLQCRAGEQARRQDSGLKG